MASSKGRTRSPLVTRAVTAVVAVVLLVAMALSTKWLTPEEALAVNPPPFNAETYAADEFGKNAALIEEKAVPLADLAKAYTADAAAACSQYGTDLGSGSCAYPVTATGQVTAVDANFMTIAVDGVPEETTVRVPLGQAISGTPIRDATGEITFGDFVGQTDFQSVANQFKILVQKNVITAISPASLQGKTVTVVGAWSTGGPKNAFTIQPVKIEAAA